MSGEPTTNPLVSCKWLSEHLNDEKIIIVDCRYNLFDKAWGKNEYDKGHIPGACFLDMEKELTGKVGEHGGRHPLPHAEAFEESMRQIGLEEGKTVIAYDWDGSGASRLWWLLNYFGYPHVRILDGGYDGWVDSGLRITKEVPDTKRGSFSAHITGHILVSRADLDKLPHGTRIIDVRDRERYLGIVEPIDKVAGHIPGAINIPYKDIVEKPGKFKNYNELKEIFSQSGEEPVVYCGSGITSCVNFVALESIGKHPKLYAGSWSDWISYEDSEIATGEHS